MGIWGFLKGINRIETDGRRSLVSPQGKNRPSCTKGTDCSLQREQVNLQKMQVGSPKGSILKTCKIPIRRRNGSLKEGSVVIYME